MSCSYPASHAIVVGGGLAGMAAANTILECGGKVILLDKSSFCGGNSTKATSGINGANTRTQRVVGIEDSNELFTSDTMKGGAKKPEIVKVLCHNSGADVEWLMDKFNLDLSLLARLGGHSAPRTHRGAERFPGMTITYALIQMLERVAEVGDRAQIITKACATELVTNKKGDCVGLKYTKGGITYEEHGPVILASGGFGCDFGSDSLLAKHRPDLLHLPTTNGEHCTGDGIKMGTKINASSIDLEWVQVHPTGLVNPQAPDNKVLFLAAEALRGVGGLVFDKNGRRFANELGRRDYVTGEIWKNEGPFRLALNKAASKELIWHCKHYTGRNVMKFFETGKALAAEMGINVEVLAEEHQKHYEAAEAQRKDPEGGKWPAYPSGKTHDEASGKTGSGKKFYLNYIKGEQVASEPFYVAFITPVIHYCMGGLEIDEHSRVVSPTGPVKGLYAAGEVAGGVHGNNRLGGNSLLDCVVFGRVAGRHCAKYMLGDITHTSLQELSAGGLTGKVEGSKLAGGSYEDGMNQKSGVKAAAGSAAAPGAAAGVVATYTKEEVAQHNSKDSCWVILNNRVLDVTDFLPDHPGGELAILTFAGRDATEEFDMIHPGDVIDKYAPEAVIGVVGDAAAAAASATAAAAAGSAGKKLAKAARSSDIDEGEGQIGGWFGAVIYMAFSFLRQIFGTIFSSSNLQFSNDRSGLTRSAAFLVLFQFIHAIGNLHVFLGPDDFNGYGYFYVRLYVLVPANVVEIYLLLCAILHVMVALKRTATITAQYSLSSGQLNLFLSGVVLLAFMVIHLFQFRFGECDNFLVRPPRYLLNLSPADWLHLRLFWSTDHTIEPVAVRDIYKLEHQVFADPRWCIFYVVSTLVFAAHMYWGWKKMMVSTAFGIPKAQHKRVGQVGFVVTAVLALMYLSFPIYCHFFSSVPGDVKGQY